MPFIKEGYKSYFAEKRIWRTQSQKVCFTGFIDSTKITADENGDKIVPIGTFISAEGEVCKLSGSAFDKTPVGILDMTMNLRYGDDLVPLAVEGYPFGEALNWEGKTGDQDTDSSNFTQDAVTALKDILPKITLNVPEGE